MSDEAQAELYFPLPERAAGGITEFSINLSVGASIEVNGRDWLKVGNSGGMKWSKLPTVEELKAATSYIQKGLLEPTINEMIGLMGQSVVEQQMNR